MKMNTCVCINIPMSTTDLVGLHFYWTP